MEMTTTEVSLRMLKPSGDLWLTRKTVADGEERIFSKEVEHSEENVEAAKEEIIWG